MLKVGITGGIGSGKSIVSKAFQTLGAPVYDADSRAKWLMTNDSKLKADIVKNFGEQSYGVDGVLNRAYLASVVFSDKEKTKLINGLVHPRVGEDFNNWVINQNSSYIIKEAALMIESGSYKELDKLILVKAPEKLRIKRVLNRDTHRTEESVRSIIQKQLSENEMAEFADIVINNGGYEPILMKIIDLHDEFITGK